MAPVILVKYKECLRFFTTVKYLRPRQILFRCYRKFSKPLTKALITFPINGRYVPAVNSSLRLLVDPLIKPQSISITGTRLKFSFLNCELSLSHGDWTVLNAHLLWRYNLHYFDDLNAESSIQRRQVHLALIHSWIREHQKKKKWGIGFDPYPTSLRICNWVKFQLARKTECKEIDESLFVQAKWLSKNVEYHLGGNHLIANAKALIFAGVYFRGDKANNFLRQGLKIFSEELRHQIQFDGGHFELSPMYHNIILEDVLDVVNILFSSQVSELCKKPKNFYWLQRRCCLGQP